MKEQYPLLDPLYIRKLLLLSIDFLYIKKPSLQNWFIKNVLKTWQDKKNMYNHKIYNFIIEQMRYWNLIKMSVIVFGLITYIIPSYGQDVVLDSKNKLNTIEKMINISQVTIDDSIPYKIISDTIKWQCTTQDIKSAEDRYTNFVNDKKNQSYFIYKNNIDQKSKFNSIRNMISKTDTTLCSQKLFLYKMLEKIQSKPDNTNNIKIIDHISTLSDKEKVFGEVATFYIKDRLYKLIEDKIFDKYDLQAIDDNKIVIEYVNKCGTMHGSYKMSISKSWIKTIKSISIKINICNKDNYISNFKNYVSQLLVHELWHYVYYFKDANNTVFDNICRQDKKNICSTKNDFVSDYATSNKEEDYAETFAYRYLVDGSTKSTRRIISPNNVSSSTKIHWSATIENKQKKIEHFKKLFK